MRDADPAPTTTVLPTTSPPPVTLNHVLCSAAGDNQDRPDFAAQAVYEAFLRGDESCAAELMNDEAQATACFGEGPQRGH